MSKPSLKEQTEILSTSFNGAMKQLIKVKEERDKLLEALEKSQGHLQYQQKLGCNCSLENGKCNMCKQIEMNEEIIAKAEGDN